MDTPQLLMALAIAVGMLLVGVMAIVPTAMETGPNGTQAGSPGRRPRSWHRRPPGGGHGSAHLAA